MPPKHIKQINQRHRRAVAPYNFVELPAKVVAAESIPSRSSYLDDNIGKRYTGKLTCTLTTVSPLYIRGGFSPESFLDSMRRSNSLDDLDALEVESGETARAKRADFYKQPGTQTPCIPGSSLRGMLRHLIEIVSFSKISHVSDKQKFFFRAVATTPRDDSLASEYKSYVTPNRIKAGYLRKDSKGWYIQPAREIRVGGKKYTFAWVKESRVNLRGENELFGFDDANYRPQYIPVTYDHVAIDQNDRARRFFASNVGNSTRYPKKGLLVTSGNMNLGGGGASPRRNHCVVFEGGDQKRRIDSTALAHYQEALTEFQKSPPFDESLGLLPREIAEGKYEKRAIFYYEPGDGSPIGFFGQSPNFRIPYSRQSNGHASTAKDFIPQSLQSPDIIDLAESLFGFVRDEKMDGARQSQPGRIFVNDAMYKEHTAGIWLSENAIVPKILGGPKPTTISHYLVQPEETNAQKNKLKHYASTLEETVIRGHKLYWHKGNVQLAEICAEPDEISEAKSQYTEIKPVRSGVSFDFDIDFEQLSEVELGLLLWVLSLSKEQPPNPGKPNEEYCLSLGMGKPLGMGAIKLDYQLSISDRPNRYQTLFNNNGWALASTSTTAEEQNFFISSFEQYMLDLATGISESDHPINKRASTLKEVPRIEMLLAMLRFDSMPPQAITRYLKLDPTNEYKDRKVLPTPLDIMRIDDRRRPYDPSEEELLETDTEIEEAEDKTVADLANLFNRRL